jgi:hypothetical protein
MPSTVGRAENRGLGLAHQPLLASYHIVGRKKFMLKTGLSLSALIWLFFPLSIQAQPGGPPGGTATVSGIVTLEGKPVGGAIVYLSDPSWGGYAYPTDGNGRFHIAHIVAGEYRISARASAHISPGVDDMKKGLLLVVAEGQKLKEVALKIERGGAIAGKITDAQGRPVIESALGISYQRVQWSIPVSVTQTQPVNRRLE